MGKLTRGDRNARIRDLERRLEESERRLEETQALAHIGSWEWVMHEDREWESAWSREMLRIFGRELEGPPPKLGELIDSIHPDDREEFERLAARVRSAPGLFRHDYRIVDAAGEVRHLQARGEVVEGVGDTPRRTYGATQDISELKRSEAQLAQAQRLESVGQLASGVAHDFNNLLAVILNFSECLLEEADDDETAESLREIERAAGSAAELTRRLLLFSRRDAPELQSVDLSAMVHETESLLRRTIGEHIEMTVDALPDLPPVRLAAGEAEQVLINLVVNARDAVSPGGTIAVTLRELDSEAVSAAPSLELTVADDGVGMTKEVAAQAFDPFFTTKSRGHGTGLGLATVYGIASRAGGWVTIESEPGRGTAVSVRLPIAAKEGVSVPEPRKAPPLSGEGRTVLVVDNERAVLTIVCRMLAKHGYRTLAAAAGTEAEAILTGSDGDVDLLLTDVLMPGMSGRDLVGRLRERGMRLPAIYMSGYGDDASSLGPWEDGVTVLQKPFKAEQLLHAVGEALAEGEARR